MISHIILTSIGSLYADDLRIITQSNNFEVAKERQLEALFDFSK